jgi:phosphohistidine phosphatase
MELVVIRHAIAEDREAYAATGADDRLRPLTKEGKRKMRRGAKGLRVVAPRIDILASSPLVRAQETAEIVVSAYEGLGIETVAELEPDRDPAALRDWLAERPASAIVGVVGHEPHLGRLVTWLLAGRRDTRVELKKGAACLLSFEGAPAPGKALLRWSLTPAQLRSLGR